MASNLIFRRLLASSWSSLKNGNISTASFSSKTNFETLSITVPKPFVYNVELNRPEKMNAMNNTMWTEIGKCFEQLNADSKCRVIVLTGAGKMFTAGLDVKEAMQMGQQLAEVEDVARKAKLVNKKIIEYQSSITQIERCSKPVLAATHSACIGGGAAILTATDMRYCTNDAWFQVKEVILGLTVDVGTIQRLPKLIGSDSLSRELIYTGRKMDAAEALKCGLVSRVYDSKESMISGVLEVAQDIAAKSPTAVQVSKISYVYSRDHTVQEGLDQIALWNQLMLQSEDFITASVAVATKQTDEVKFSDY